MSSKLPTDATSAPVKEPITINESRQYTALAKKALSFQKRQKFTNICCITLCPLIMVVISAGLGSLIQTLIARSTVVYEYIYCSNVDNMDSNNVPFWDTSDWRLKNISSAGIPGVKLSELYTTNWFIYLVLSTTRGPGAALALSKKPCTYWFGEQYPSSALYEKPTVAVGNLVKDSSYLPQPRIGWLQTLTNATTVAATINVFNQHQQRAWAVIGADVSIDLNAIGVKPQATPLSVVQFLTLPPQPLFTPPNATSNGLLDTIPTKYYVSLTSATNFTNISFIPVPFYNLVSTPAGQNDLDDIISSGIRNATEEIKKLDKTGLTGRNTTRYNQVFVEAAKLLSPLPHGSIYFQKIDHASKSYKYTLSFGEDDRLVSSSNFPPAGRRLLLHQTQLSNAILRTGNISSLSTAQITQGLRLMPQLTNTELKLSFGGVIGGILYPFGVSFLLPIFAIMLVSEKEKRILVMMKMNGMKNFPYYVSHYVTFFVMYVVSSFIFLVSGAIGKLTMFTLTGPGLLVWMFFLWGHNQIALAFFFANFFNKSRFALIVVFLIVLCSVVISLVIETLFVESPAPYALFIWPPFAFYRALGLMNRGTLTATSIPYKFSRLGPSDELFAAMQFLIFEIPIVLGAAYYLGNVFPSDFGVKKPLNFPFINAKKWWLNRKGSPDGKINDEEILATNIVISEEETQYEDSDVKAERAKVLDPEFDAKNYTIAMSNMRKVYAGRGGAAPKLAVKDVTLAVEPNTTFGLLGPNGAGKTTLISILTGLYEASTGKARIAGYDIKADTDQVYKVVGICPQFDIQWDELTVGEHLYFYARLKGIIPSHERKAVKYALESVALLKFENRLTKGLSGGERRRLSIAIALLGEPKVVFLDEPTVMTFNQTGLDPEVRRLIWNIVNEARAGRTVVLTTHSMEEAEALCQRIGIMAKGTLRCLSNPTRLKALYGSGFRLYANSLEDDTPKVSAYLESLLPAGWKKIDSFATNTSYEFPRAAGSVSKLFQRIEAEKAEQGILDWGIGETTLEEVFIRLIDEGDASAEA